MQQKVYIGKRTQIVLQQLYFFIQTTRRVNEYDRAEEKKKINSPHIVLRSVLLCSTDIFNATHTNKNVKAVQKHFAEM